MSNNKSLSQYERLLIALRSQLLGMEFYNAVRALDFAKRHHKGTRRDGRTPEFQHQVEIALYILTLKNVGELQNVIAAALLHDVREDYDVPHQELVNRFGARVAEIVAKLTKKFDGVEKNVLQYFKDISEDSAASVIKGSDRVHNVQSMVGVFALDKQREYLDEVKTHFLPMLKRARYSFPEQSAAYHNIEHMLKSQIRLVDAIHEAMAAAANAVVHVQGIGDQSDSTQDAGAAVDTQTQHLQLPDPATSGVADGGTVVINV